MSKQGDNLKLWKKSIPRLIEEAKERGIYSCEPMFDSSYPGKCTTFLFNGFAHDRDRDEYINDPEALVSIEHVLVACSRCHSILDGNKDLREATFQKLRPNRT